MYLYIADNAIKRKLEFTELFPDHYSIDTDDILVILLVSEYTISETEFKQRYQDWLED